MEQFQDAIDERCMHIVYEAGDSVDALKPQHCVEHEGYRFHATWLSDEVLDIEPAEWADVPAILAVPPDQDADIHILNRLNDDCLLAIFEAAPLNIMDLAEIAATCRRFRPLALRVAAARHNQIDHFYRSAAGPLWRIEQVFRLLGAAFVAIGFDEDSDIECGMIAEHCPHVRQLRCHMQELQSTGDLYALLGRLEHLDLHVNLTGTCIDLRWWPTDRMPLRRLKITCGTGLLGPTCPVRLPHGQLTHLLDFHLDHARIAANETFFVHNPQLEILTLNNNVFGNLVDLR